MAEPIYIPTSSVGELPLPHTSPAFDVFIGFLMMAILPVDLPWWLSGKKSTYSVGDVGSNSGSGRSPGEGSGISSIFLGEIP